MRLLILLLLSLSLWAEPLRVASSFVIPPFEFTRRKKQVGLEVDLIQAIAQKMGREIVFLDVPHAQLMKMLAAEECDLIMGGFVDSIPLEGGVWSLPYLTAPFAILVDRQCRPHIHSFEELKGKCVGAVKGELCAEALQHFGQIKYYEVDRMLSALTDLTLGEIDALVRPEPAALYLQYSSSTIHCIALMPQSEQGLVFGVRAHLEEAFNQAMSDLSEDQITARWLGIKKTLFVGNGMVGKEVKDGFKKR